MLVFEVVSCTVSCLL